MIRRVLARVASLFPRRRPDRQVYRFHDGTRWRHADPLIIQRGMGDDWGNWFSALENLAADQARGYTPELPHLIGGVASAVRKAFGLEPLGTDHRGRPTGLTDLECLSLLTGFLDWLREVQFDFLPAAGGKAKPAPEDDDLDDTAEMEATPATLTDAK